MRIGPASPSNPRHYSVGRANSSAQRTYGLTFDRLTPAQQIAVTIAEQIRQDSGARAYTIALAKVHFTDEELVELLLVAGFYIMTAGVLVSLDVEIEDGPALGETMAAAS